MLGNAQDLMGAGFSSIQVRSIKGSHTFNAAATGTNQSTAYLINTSFTEFDSVPTGAGCILPTARSGLAQPGDVVLIANSGDNILRVYPPIGGRISQANTDTAVQIPSLGAGQFISRGDGSFFAFLTNVVPGTGKPARPPGQMPPAPPAPTPPAPGPGPTPPAPTPPSPPPAPALKPQLVVMGDSQTEQLFLTAGQRWANMRAAELGIPLLNASKSGTVMQHRADASGSPRPDNGRSRLGMVTGSNLSEYYEILHGFNDMRYTGAPATMNLANFITDYTFVVDSLIDAGVSPANITIGSPCWATNALYTTGSTGFTGSSRTIHEQYVAALYTLAFQKGCKYAAVYERMRDNGGASLIDADNVHANAAGSVQIQLAMAGAAVPSTGTWTAGTPTPAPPAPTPPAPNPPPPAPTPPAPAPGGGTAIVFAERSTALSDIGGAGSEIYGASTGSAYSGIGLSVGVLAEGADGWIEAAYVDNTTAGAVLTFDPVGGIPLYDSNDYMAHFVPAGTVLQGQNVGATSATLSAGAHAMTPSAQTRMRLRRNSAGVVTIETTTNNWATFTVRHTFDGASTGPLYARCYTTTERRLNQVRVFGLA